VDSHALRCALDAACLSGIFLSVLGWLPVLLACIASALAAIHYGIWIYDRLYNNPNRPR